MNISEPATMLTDYALSLLSVLLGLSLLRRAQGHRVGLWVSAFLVTAFAALAGGTAHGFRIPLGENWSLLWRITVCSIALGSVLLIAAGVRSAVRPETRDESARRNGHSWLKRAIGLSLLGLAVLVLKLSPDRNFNHNDLYHVIQAGGLYCLYRGAVLLHGLSESGRRRGNGS